MTDESTDKFRDTRQFAAVGIDTDGQIKPIDELSFKPEGGWGRRMEPLDIMKSRSRWEWRFPEGRLQVKRTQDIPQGAVTARQHFGMTEERMRADTAIGAITVEDMDSGKVYSGRELCRILGWDSAGGGPTTTA